MGKLVRLPAIDRLRGAGAGVILLSLLVRLPRPAIALVAALLVLPHNALDGWHPATPCTQRPSVWRADGPADTVRPPDSCGQPHAGEKYRIISDLGNGTDHASWLALLPT